MDKNFVHSLRFGCIQSRVVRKEAGNSHTVREPSIDCRFDEAGR
jgi:hypothetical protein